MESVGEYEYNTKDLIGHGAFAVVFKGRHKKHHDQVVAIKSVSKKNIGKSQQFLGKEIKILQEVTKLHHKNVVGLLECVETAQKLYIVIEYCNGGDLSEYLNAKGTLSEDTIRLFLRQIAEAVKVLHSKGVVHRDLKPQNILLCHSGKPNPSPSDITLKIADFGFARFLQDGNMAATLCGSPMYMAPEVIMSIKYDAKADLWSIGTIVFQCLTGKAPFMAPNPPALKQFYEKNANLAPRIPSGTSSELTELLIGLMKRDAKDRIEFDEFFNHPFLKLDRPRSSSPVPVPSRRSVSPERVSPYSPLSPYGSPSPQCWDREVGGEDMAQSPSPTSSSPLQHLKLFQSGRRESSPSPIEQDFVMIPRNVADDIKNYEQNRNMSPKRQRSDPKASPCKIPISNSAFRKSGHNANINLTTKAVSYQTMKSSSEESSRPTSLPMEVEGAEASNPRRTSPFTFETSEAYPVPRPAETYEQVERSLQNTPASSPHDNFDLAKRLVSPGTSPTSPKDPFGPQTEPIAMMRRSSINSIGSDICRMPEITSFTPPAVQFSIGTPPSGSRLRSNSMGTTPPLSSGRQTPTGWKCQATTPPLSAHGSPMRRSGNTPPVTNSAQMSGTSNSLSPVLGSPSKELWRGEHLRCHTEPSLGAIRALDYRNVNNPHCQFRVPFGGRTMTLPEFGTKDMWPMPPSPPGAALMPYSQQQQQCPHHHHHHHPPPPSHYTPPPPPPCPHYYMTCCSQSSPNRGRRYSGTMVYTDSSPTNHAFLYGNSPQKNETYFVAPELNEETLLEKEHNEILAKLNFVAALVKCILELAKIRSSVLVARLTNSIFQDEVFQNAGHVTEGYHKAIQLLLYMKALQLLNTSLQLSKQEVKRGNLQPSYAVKNVLKQMNDQYHYCLDMSQELNKTGLLQSVGVDMSAVNITADKILYRYAIEMCQSAALEELLGEPKESFRRYQTAQILLHSLSQQVNDKRDQDVLQKYRHAVEKRLTVLSNSGYAYAYDTQ